VYAYYGQSWQPQLSLYGHYHHWADSGEQHPVRCIYNRAWQVKTAFLHRLGMGVQPTSIGGLWVVCHKGQYRVKAQPYRLPRPKPWVMA